MIAASPTDIQPVLDAVTRSAARLCDAYDATTFLLRGDSLVVGAHDGTISLNFDHLPLTRGYVTSRAVIDRVPVHVHDLPLAADEFPDGQRLALQMDFRTILATPLLRKGEAIGALMIRRAEVRPFSQRQIELLKTFADQAVIAIENARLFDEVEARNRDLSESLERQTAMSEILSVISSSPTDAQPVFETIAESAARLCNARFCAVYRFDGELIHFVAQHGYSPEAIEIQRRAFPMPPGRASGASRAILSGAVEQIPDVTADPDYRIVDTARANNNSSVLAVPILRDGRPVGSINIGRHEKGNFPSRQIELLRTFADQAVIAIENVRLFDEVQARNRELTESLERQTAMSDILRVISSSPTNVQPVFETIAESAARLCQGRFCAVFRFDGELIHFMAQHGMSAAAADLQRRAFPSPPGHTSAAARAILSAEVVQIPDVELDPSFALGTLTKEMGARSVLAVPILRDGRPVGSINIGRPETGEFGPRQISLLRTFADQAVIAIENVRLFDEVQARTAEVTEALQQQTATADVLKVISRSAFDLDPVLQTLVESAIRLCGADKGAITLREGNDLRFRAGAGQSPELRAYEQANPHRLGRGTFQGRAAIEGRTIHVPDVLSDPEYERKETAAFGIRAVLSVPLKRGAEVIGVFGLARATVGSFAPRQIELVESFADQAVIAIENARLFEEVQAKTRDLEESLTFQKATSDVLEVIGRSASDLQPVFDVILDTAADLCHADMSVLRLMHDGALHHVADSRRNDPAVVQHSRDNPILPVDRSSVAGRVAIAGHTVHIPDVPGDEDLTFLRALDSPIGSVLGVPLVQDGKVAGVIALLRRVAQPFTQRQIELVETFADQAVIAIENVRLFDEVQARTRDLSEALEQQTATADVLKAISRSTFNLPSVLQTLVQSAARLCEADISTISREIDGKLYDSESYGLQQGLLELIRTIPIEPDRGSAAGRALLEGKVIQIVDVLADPEYTFSKEARGIAGYRTILGVPMLREHLPIGVLTLARRDVKPFTERQIELVSTFADQAVIAIENVRLFDEVQARTAELQQTLEYQTATSEVLNVISRSPSEVQPVLDVIIETAVRLCEADFGTIAQESEGRFFRTGQYGSISAEFREFMSHAPVEMTRGSITGRTLVEGKVVHVLDAKNDPEYTWIEALQAEEIRSGLGVPLMRDGAPIGAIALVRRSVRPFTDKQIELVTTFADQAVIAIENARLFEEVQARTQELTRSLDDLRTAQDRLVQTEKLASLGQLTAGIAHEIKNPLNFVNNFAALSTELIDELGESLRGAQLDEKSRASIAEITELLKGNLQKVVQHGRRADSIVKNMLLHSRSGSGEHRPSDINSIVEEALNLAYHGARAEKQGFNITLERTLDPAAGDVDLFPQEITRVLLNLISNGFYAATKRRAVASAGYEPKLSAATKSLGDRVEIRIRDNGTGIPNEVKERMFNPFFTTKPAGEGTGLGLSLSHDIIVKQHSGTIEVETEPGSFTEFRIVLPRNAAVLGGSRGNS